MIAAPIRREVQVDGRVRYWGEIARPGETVPRILRVVTLDDGETIHNAFFDRASTRLDLSTLEANALPLRSYRIA